MDNQTLNEYMFRENENSNAIKQQNMKDLIEDFKIKIQKIERKPNHDKAVKNIILQIREAKIDEKSKLALVRLAMSKYSDKYLSSKEFLRGLTDEQKVQLVEYMDKNNTNEIKAVIYHMADKSLKLKMAEKKFGKDSNEYREIFNQFASREQRRADKSVKQVQEEIEEIIPATITEEETLEVETPEEKDMSKEVKGLKLNLGEYGKYIRYIERGEAEPDTITSIVKTNFSKRKERALFELLLSKMQTTEEYKAAFNLIPDEQKDAIYMILPEEKKELLEYKSKFKNEENKSRKVTEKVKNVTEKRMEVSWIKEKMAALEKGFEKILGKKDKGEDRV